jgi:signal transduction histidine kinase
MLNFARGAARNSSEVYLHHEVESTLAIFSEVLERSGVRVEVDVPADLPPLVGIQADVDQLLLNLISNARDATRDGGHLSIRAAVVEGRIELTIADDGCGIAPENMAKIQEPFFTTKSTGSGLGLSICRSILAQMRGKLIFESTPGRGTTVRVLLPLVQET